MVMLFSEIKALNYSVEFGTASRTVRERSNRFDIRTTLNERLTNADKRSVTPAIATPPLLPFQDPRLASNSGTENDFAVFTRAANSRRGSVSCFNA